MAFVFYDTETTGIDTAFDQILQFAAIYTDHELNELDRFEIRCRLLPHVVPSPGAMRVTGVTAAQLVDQTLPSHYTMIRAIRDKLVSWSPAVFLGFNSLDFDEHLLRQALYKTLHPPYLTNTNGNARSDIMRIVQAASLFAPQSLVFPEDNGRTVFKLDRLAPANGFNHAQAHDALGDVEATIFLCRLLMERAPEVWSAFMRFSQKAAVVDYISAERMFCLSDFYFGRPYSWLVTAIGNNPGNASEFYAYDLATDPETLAALSEAGLVARLGRSPKPIRRLKTNGSPMLVAAGKAPAIAGSLQLGMAELERRAELLHTDSALRQRLVSAFHSIKGEREPSPYVEKQIYDGFFSAADSVLLDAFHKSAWDERLAIVENLQDTRLKLIGQQLLHLERPDLFQEEECLKRDQAHARRILGADGEVPWLTLSQALQQFDDLLAECDLNEEVRLRDHREYLSESLGRARSLLL